MLADKLQQAVAVGKGDVAPHFGAAGGDAGEIAKAAACELEITRALRVVQHLVHIGKGEQVRKMRHGGEDLVVFGGGHLVDLRADALPQRGDGVQAACVLLFVRAKDEFFALIQPKLGGERAAAVGACDGVAGDTTGVVLRQVLGEGGEGGLFGAAHVADDGVRRQQGGEGLADDGQAGDGGGDEHEVAVLEGSGGDLAAGGDAGEIAKAAACEVEVVRALRVV